MVNIEVDPLLPHSLVVVEGNTGIISTRCGGEYGIALDLPYRDVHVVGEDKGHPVVIHQDVFW